MGLVSESRWNWLESWRGTLFLIGGAIFVVDTALVAWSVFGGREFMPALGQAFVGAAWTAAFLGLLGCYPDVSDRSPNLARSGAVFAALGVVTMAAMALTSLGYFAGVLPGEFSEVGMVFLPPVFLATVFGFGLFGVASLRTVPLDRTVSALFFLLPLTFLFNIGTGMAGVGTMETVLGVVTVLTLTMLAIGYLFRTGRATGDAGAAGAGDVASG